MKRSLTAFTISLCLGLNLNGDSIRGEVKSFNELRENILEDFKDDLEDTLLVMDDDDTLTMMKCDTKNPSKENCQYLGGPAWFAWQQKLLDKNQSIAKNFNELLDISNLLFSLNNMEYTQNDVPDVLKSLTNAQLNLLVLTARGGEAADATTNQFSNLYTDTTKKSTLMELIQNNALKGKRSKITSIASPFNVKGQKKEVTYKQGVMYISGQNKGELLHYLLKNTRSFNIKNIVFIDDTLQNVKDVDSAFKDSSRYNVRAYHYTALQKHKNMLTKGKNAQKYQKWANDRWDSIKKVLNKQLLWPSSL